MRTPIDPRWFSELTVVREKEQFQRLSPISVRQATSAGHARAGDTAKAREQRARVVFRRHS